jgi:hypothetical protein
MVHMQRLLVKLFPVAVLLALSGGVVFPSSAAALLGNTSPNPSDMFAIKKDGTLIPGGISHLLKNETVARVKTLKLGAYFQVVRNDPATSRTLNLEHGIDGMKCLLLVRERGDITVTIGDDSGPQKVYKIPFKKSNVCNDRDTSHRNIAEGDRGDKSQNKFFGRYRIPANTQTENSSTGTFHVPITIAYSSSVEQGNSDENSVNFRAKVDGSRSILGPLQGNSLDKTFGLRSAFFQPSSQAEREGKKDTGIRAEVQFGVPCDVREDPITRAAGLYDADTDRFGKTYLKIKRDRTSFQRSEYKESMNKYVRWDGDSNLRYRSTATEDPPADLDRDSLEYRRQLYKHSIIGMKDLDPGRPNNRITYYFVIENKYQSDTTPQRANTLNIAIPFDSIYGNIDSCEYELQPNLPGVSPTYEENDILQVNSAVEKISGGPTGPHAWQTFVARYDALPNKTINPKNRTDNPCDVAPSSRRVSCAPLFNPASTYPATRSRADNFNTDGAGKIICFFTRIQKPTNTSPDNVWRYSNMACSVLGKQPKVQILGHDLRVGDEIDTSVTIRDGKNYHSWGEYAMMSDGCNIEGRATSGADGYGGSTSPQNLLHPLTFANTNTLAQDGITPCKGNYDGGIISDFNQYRQGEVRDDTPDVVLFNQAKLNSSPKRVYYYPNATVRITENLRYGNGYNSISRIPRVIIIAKNIVVNSDVGRVDPWLIALKKDGGGGKIATCDEANGMTSQVIEDGNFPAMDTPDLLDRDTCKNQVVFNSPVMASEIYLYRTHGSTANAPAKAAEVFNLRADSFLSTYAGGSGVKAVATTDAITELPPRF